MTADGGSSSAGTVGLSDSADQQLGFNDVFSLRRPKDAKAGFASGAKSIGKGFLAGTVGLFAAPAIGAVQQGPVGFGKGLAAGLAGAVALPVVGLSVGATQMARGIYAQPTAMTQEAAGKQWDLRMREWIDNPGSALTINDPTFEAAQQRWGGVHQAATRLQSDDDFYALLALPRDATPAHIKKQYYSLAREVHPDKNPNDPAAKARFQRLGEAYQVLSDPQKRKRYDQSGTKGLGDNEFMDCALFFSMLFGSEGFHHLIGDLMISTAAREGGLDAAHLQKIQVARVAELSIMLTALLRRWVEGDEEGFREAMTAEAARLVDLSFGHLLLETIGYTYKLQADLFLGDFFERSVLNVRSTGHAVSTKVQLAKSAIKVMTAQQHVQDLEKQRAAQLAAEASSKAGTSNSATEAAGNAAHSPDSAVQSSVRRSDSSMMAPAEDEAARRQQTASHTSPTEALRYQEAHAAAQEAALPLMLATMWSANVVDIESTITRVCTTVLHDPQVPTTVRKARAVGLRELARIFCHMKPQNPKSFEDGPSAKGMLEAAMMAIVEKKFAEDDALHQSSDKSERQSV